MAALELPREKPAAGQKIYNIDSDIIETISQCKFPGSTTHVVNTILRVFLKANIEQLIKIRKERAVTIFDNYESQR